MSLTGLQHESLRADVMVTPLEDCQAVPVDVA